MAATVKEKDAGVNSILKTVTDARKTNNFESDKNVKYMKANAALRAKLEFIESKYDYTSNAK